MPDAINFTAVLREEDVLLDAQIATKAELLAAAAEHLAQATGVANEVIQKALTDREKLGSTAINHGIAVPHAGIDALASPAAVLFRLARPIDFEASDNNPVDLVFVLIWPKDKRSGLLGTLGGLCKTLRGTPLLQELRSASSPAEVRSLLDQGAIEATPRPPEN